MQPAAFTSIIRLLPHSSASSLSLVLRHAVPLLCVPPRPRALWVPTPAPRGRYSNPPPHSLNLFQPAPPSSVETLEPRPWRGAAPPPAPSSPPSVAAPAPPPPPPPPPPRASARPPRSPPPLAAASPPSPSPPQGKSKWNPDPRRLGERGLMVNDWRFLDPCRPLAAMAGSPVAVVARLTGHTAASVRACCELSQGTLFCRTFEDDDFMRHQSFQTQHSNHRDTGAKLNRRQEPRASTQQDEAAVLPTQDVSSRRPQPVVELDVGSGNLCGRASRGRDGYPGRDADDAKALEFCKLGCARASDAVDRCDEACYRFCTKHVHTAAGAATAAS
ncbi:hypothetical protein HU200_044966 [Digitaria exilis]|uniref:Uncharacterized protein n=1 Tax=Digitaria exilis TaxID=1010633 RepID=A0A835B1E4_9POAL|nr:hypothetical protein HU200_044966 [Digitaria exilis]